MGRRWTDTRLSIVTLKWMTMESSTVAEVAQVCFQQLENKQGLAEYLSGRLSASIPVCLFARVVRSSVFVCASPLHRGTRADSAQHMLALQPACIRTALTQTKSSPAGRSTDTRQPLASSETANGTRQRRGWLRSGEASSRRRRPSSFTTRRDASARHPASCYTPQRHGSFGHAIRRKRGGEGCHA